MTESGKICFTAYFEEPLEYEPALALQMKICEFKKRGLVPDVLLLLEHSPVITLGRNADWSNLLVSESSLQAHGVRRFHVDRGGDITYHGPGQLIGYPLLKLEGAERDVHLYMRNLEEAVIRTLRDYGIESGRRPKLAGVWTSRGKICAMGVHISRWITRHGFALNANTDLSYYDLIVPCGLSGSQVCSIKAILEHEVSVREVALRLTKHFGDVFARDMVPIPAAEVHGLLQDAESFFRVDFGQVRTSGA